VTGPVEHRERVATSAHDGARLEIVGPSRVGPVDLLLITHNRLEYAQRTVATLFADPAPFRVFWWDNGSTDGTAELCRGHGDPRIAAKHLSPTNVMQAAPSRWLLDQSRADLIGKVDDDTLVPRGWIEAIAPAVAGHAELGMIGCWTYWLEDFENHKEHASKKLVRVGSHCILRNIIIGGTAFLMRRTYAEKYFVTNPSGREFPIKRVEMTSDGLISGWYYPLLWAEHMDDPRSPHCMMNRAGGAGDHAALTARVRNIRDPAQYLEWIKQDASAHMLKSVRRQQWETRLRRSIFGRAHRSLRRLMSPQGMRGMKLRFQNRATGC
jgi:glycosyltransferase involved in cell wall biosynthesis